MSKDYISDTRWETIAEAQRSCVMFDWYFERIRRPVREETRATEARFWCRCNLIRKMATCWAPDIQSIPIMLQTTWAWSSMHLSAARWNCVGGARLDQEPNWRSKYIHIILVVRYYKIFLNSVAVPSLPSVSTRTQSVWGCGCALSWFRMQLYWHGAPKRLVRLMVVHQGPDPNSL